MPAAVPLLAPSPIVGVRVGIAIIFASLAPPIPVTTTVPVVVLAIMPPSIVGPVVPMPFFVMVCVAGLYFTVAAVAVPIVAPVVVAVAACRTFLAPRIPTPVVPSSPPATRISSPMVASAHVDTRLRARLGQLATVVHVPKKLSLFVLLKHLQGPRERLVEVVNLVGGVTYHLLKHLDVRRLQAPVRCLRDRRRHDIRLL